MCLIGFLLSSISFAEFGDIDKASVHGSFDGYKGHQGGSLSGVLPLGFINGYVGGETFIHRYDGDISHESRVRLEGGLETERVGVRGYVRYGKQNAMGVHARYHAGAYGFVYLYKSEGLEITTGLGTWAEQVRLLEIFRLTEDDGAGYEFGPRAHFDIEWKNLSILTEFLPSYHFRQVGIRVLPTYKQHIFWNIYYVVSGSADYISESYHIDADNWNFQLSHRVAWEFE